MIFARFFIYIFFSIHTAAFCAHSLVFESNLLSDILKHTDNNTMVILDIDNTLIEPAQSLGSDQWAWDRVSTLCKQGLIQQDAIQQTSNEWYVVHLLTKVKTLESNTAEVIDALQKQGYPVIALTTRRPRYMEITFRELKDVNINFTNDFINSCKFTYNNMIYENGITFISIENRKGAALKELLQQMVHLPEKIIFVDDKLSHVKDVEETCAQLNIDFVGVRYGAADAHVASYNSRIAEKQLSLFNQILSDDEALLLLQNKE